MGCDIHWVLEAKVGDRWVGLIASDLVNVPSGERWYAFFQEFGVRGYSDEAIEARGLPDDISDLATLMELYDHSHSWVSLDEFKAAYKRAIAKSDSAVKSDDMFGEYFDWSLVDGMECRVVMAFDS